MGLFQGVGPATSLGSAPVQMPNMIWLYRRPMLDYWAEHDETLGAERRAKVVGFAPPREAPEARAREYESKFHDLMPGGRFYNRGKRCYN
jgi:hypothetical protein